MVDTSLLSADQLASWDRDGYIVIDDPCEPALIDEVRAEVQPLYYEEFGPGDQHVENGVTFHRHPGHHDDYRWHRIRAAWRICSSVRSLALSPRVLTVLEELFGARPLPFQTLNFPTGTQQPAHFDSMAFNSDPPGYMCGVWVALEDMDMDNGPLEYYPGSHKLATPTWEVIDRETGERHSRDDFENEGEFRAARSSQYRRYCKEVVDKYGLKPEFGTIKKGQALIWSANLLHGGAAQNDKRRTRHSQVTHYFFEAPRYCTPMLTENRHVIWSYPEWVTENPLQGTPDELRAAVDSEIPSGSKVLVAGAHPDLMDLGDRPTEPFPQEDGSAVAPREFQGDLVKHLKRLKSDGANYAVFPKWVLSWLQWEATALQDHLERRCRPVFRDGTIGAIYSI